MKKIDKSKIVIKNYFGKDVNSLLDQVCRMRIEFFREYPYLYVGNYEYEKEYITGLSKSSRSMIASAYYENELIAISTALPLVSEADILEELPKIFSNAGYDPTRYYYYGEIIILPDYRGIKLSQRLYNEHQTFAQKWGYKNACLAVVVRDKNDKENQQIILILIVSGLI